jgi:hypothetical protein
MNERLVEDWLTKANERSFQTPFAQSLLADGMQVVRVGHSPHEHGKDIIAIASDGGTHAYQLKTGDLDLKGLEKHHSQIVALVESAVDHPGVTGQSWHHPHLVISGTMSPPAADRLRTYNAGWKKRRYNAVQLVTGSQLIAKFSKMAANFWPQSPRDSRSFLSLYLADAVSALDRDGFVGVIAGVVATENRLTKSETLRRLAAANLFASYALAPFYSKANHWEVIQGWTITAAYIAWAAERARLSAASWKASFRLAVNAALEALSLLASEIIEPKALYPPGFELDQITRSRSTICAGVVATKILLELQQGTRWREEQRAKALIEDMISRERFFPWGESAVPFFMMIIWALDKLRADQFSDGILLRTISIIAHINSRLNAPKLPPPYDSADEANAKLLRRQLNGEKQLDTRAAAAYTLEPLVTIAARRLWRNTLASIWKQISRISLLRLVPDIPRDILLWRWNYKSGVEQSRLYDTPQSWRQLLIEARRSDEHLLPRVLRDNFDFALLFVLCYPHRFATPLIKYLDESIRKI